MVRGLARRLVEASTLDFVDRCAAADSVWPCFNRHLVHVVGVVGLQPHGLVPWGRCDLEPGFRHRVDLGAIGATGAWQRAPQPNTHRFVSSLHALLGVMLRMGIALLRPDDVDKPLIQLAHAEPGLFRASGR